MNLAAPLADGTQIVVPARAPPVRAGSGGVGETAPTEPAGPVHLNTATLDQLDALVGLGSVTAQKILDYRSGARLPLRVSTSSLATPGIGDSKAPCGASSATWSPRGTGGRSARLLAAALCIGIAAANAARLTAPALAFGAVALVAAATLVAGERRVEPTLAVALALAGWWWGKPSGSFPLTRSVLTAEARQRG